MLDSMDIPTQLRDAIAEFKELVDKDVYTPEGAYGECDRVSRKFVEYVEDNFGGDCKLMWVRHPLIDISRGRQYNGFYKEDIHHCITVINGMVVDWTARQFDPCANVPEVYPAKSLVGKWKEIDIG